MRTREGERPVFYVPRIPVRQSDELVASVRHLPASWHVDARVLGERCRAAIGLGGWAVELLDGQPLGDGARAWGSGMEITSRPSRATGGTWPARSPAGPLSEARHGASFGTDAEPAGGVRTSSRRASRASSCPMARGSVHATAATSATRWTRTGRTWSSSTSTSTGTRDAVSARATRPAGPRSWRPASRTWHGCAVTGAGRMVRAWRLRPGSGA